MEATKEELENFVREFLPKGNYYKEFLQAFKDESGNLKLIPEFFLREFLNTAISDRDILVCLGMPGINYDIFSLAYENYSNRLGASRFLFWERAVQRGLFNYCLKNVDQLEEHYISHLRRSHFSSDASRFVFWCMRYWRAGGFEFLCKYGDVFFKNSLPSIRFYDVVGSFPYRESISGVSFDVLMYKEFCSLKKFFVGYDYVKFIGNWVNGKVVTSASITKYSVKKHIVEILEKILLFGWSKGFDRFEIFSAIRKLIEFNCCTLKTLNEVIGRVYKDMEVELLVALVRTFNYIKLPEEAVNTLPQEFWVKVYS